MLKKEDLKSPVKLKHIFSLLNNFKYKDKWWIIDIDDNRLRLMAVIEFRDNRMYIKHIVTEKA